MKKEILISILLGFGVGIIITFSLYFSRNALNKSNQIISPLVQEPSPEPKITSSFQSLSIISPLDQSIASLAKTLLSGTTSPKSWVIILSEKGEKVIQADDKGNFETEISLISGENEIEIQSISSSGEKASKNITIVYSTAEI